MPGCCGNVNSASEQWIRAHSRELRTVPSPDAGAWKSADVYPDRQSFVLALKHHGIIKAVGVDDEAKLWQTRVKAWAALESRGIPEGRLNWSYGGGSDRRCPEEGCDSTGFRNERGVDGLTCIECERVTPKEAWA